MSEKENQSSENEENLPIENESIIELVEELFDQMDKDEIYEGIPVVGVRGRRT